MWLDMRTEYIDANFDKFTEYLYANRNKATDTFYDSSIDLLRRRIDEVISYIASEPLSAQDTALQDCEDKERVLLWIQLLGVYILVEDTQNKPSALRAFVYQLLLLSQVCPSERAEELADLALSLIVNDEQFSPGYSWNDIRNFYPEVLATKIITYASCGKTLLNEKWYEGNGYARIGNKKMQIMNLQDKESAYKQQESFNICDNRIAIMSPQKDKLKQSQQKDMSALSAFTKDFVNEMASSNLHLGEKKLKQYYPDAYRTVEVRITSVSYNSIKAITIDRDYYQLKGLIEMKNIFYYSLPDLVKYWKPGDELPCRITHIKPDGTAVFDVTKELTNYVVNEHVEPHTTTKGIAEKINNGKHTMWTTDMGVPMYTQNKQYEPGTVAELVVTAVNPNGYIYCEVETELDETFFDPTPSRRNLLTSFCYEKIDDDTPEEETKDVQRIEYSDIRAAMKCIYIQQRAETEPMEKYRMLCALEIISQLVDDKETVSFVHFMTQYLCNIIYFAKAQYEQMFTPQLNDLICNDPAVVRRMEIIDVLQCYGNEEKEETLETAVVNPDQSISHLAKVIQSCNRLQGVLSDAMRNAIKHEMLKMLRVDDETATDLEEEGGVYLGIENGHQEFKTSIVYPPDNQMQPAPEIQKMNIFKAVCAFLNSESGGIVYLGVNDLGAVTGLEQDLQYLKKSLDGYMRYITDEAKEVFGLGVLTFIDIQPMYNEKVVAINVKPCDYKVVELAGRAYIRINAESREMTKSVRLRIEERRRTFDKHKAESVSALQSAIANRRQVIVHGYSSSNSGIKGDRNLEPFAFANGMKHIWCYDIDGEQVKLFSVTRMSNVEILEKEWENTQYHKEGKIDIFHMTGNETFKVSLQLDRMAYNLIMEEYPESQRYLEDTGNDNWILNTSVCSIYGVGRFYTGLADHITILDAPQLEQYAKEYFKRHYE